MELNITNHASDIPFSLIVQELLTGNIEQSDVKYAVYKKMLGVAAIDVPDIETAISLRFNRGSLSIEPGVSPAAAILIRTPSDNVMDLNVVDIRWGLPCYLNEAGRRVIRSIVSGKIKIKGLLTHPIFLIHFTVIMSVM